jgi:hypothetical protein
VCCAAADVLSVSADATVYSGCGCTGKLCSSDALILLSVVFAPCHCQTHTVPSAAAVANRPELLVAPPAQTHTMNAGVSK